MPGAERPPQPAANDGGSTGASGLRARIDRWLDSDLVGVAATLYTFAVLVLAFVVFRVGGGVAGMIVIVAAWIPMVIFAIQGRGKPPARLGMAAPGEGPRHRVLVIANRGLEDPALCAEVCRRSDRTATEAMILAPVVASSPLRELADDVDRELDLARRRLDAAIRSLRGEGVTASGRADIADPMESLLDGLREFPPNEILMLPDREADWHSAADLAEQVRDEVGPPVTAIDPSSTAAPDSSG
jgi:hypothetical protein